MSRKPSWQGIRGIVFDAVGTLIKPVPSVAEAYMAAAQRQGVVLDRQVVQARFQVHFHNGADHAGNGSLSTDEATERRRWRKIVAGVLPEVREVDHAFDELWVHFSRPESWRCFPDVPQVLAELTDMGILVCVGSNFDGRLRGVVQGLPELGRWVDSLVISSEVGYRKPHPLFFAAVCSHLGLSGPQVLCVGDDLENDVHGATRAGLRGLLLNREMDRPVNLPHVPDLTSLVEMDFMQT
jgi:putative hydrolase of the HAD superfamily